MKSTIVKRSIVVAGHKTSVSLEDAFWRGLKEVAGERHMTLSELVGSIDSGRQHGNLSSAIRLFVLNHYRSELEGGISARPATHALVAAQVALPAIELRQSPAPRHESKADIARTLLNRRG